MCRPSLGGLSRQGLLWGVAALAALSAALVGGSWLFTKEPIALPHSRIATSITFRIDAPSPACTLVKYSGWQDVGDLGIWTTLDFAPVFVSRMRSCTILCGTAVVFLLLAILFAIIGHCNSDNKTIIACGLFILGGLSLGTGLVIFASSLSETVLEITQYHREPPFGPLYDYRYGWCFFAAGGAFIMTNMAALFSISGYLNRFASVDEMVRRTVPGAERKLLEHQHLSSEYLVPLQYDAPPVERRDAAHAPTKTPPDNHNSTAPLSFSNVPMKYGTMQLESPSTLQCTSTLHQGFLGVTDLGSSSSTSSSGYCGRSKTLGYKNKKKCEKSEAFQGPETSFADFGKRTTNEFSFSGSAV
ncbi:unnamed protein product [Phaedon cochleariae]|uniref:Voltage-dependent calcium channel gamma-5 subunit n=1 Tax=Phaedon cochleariae TaxID=80249 RepID=A0A9N9SEY1_PHACE|nr:unnamed protein product [Phaedon cochleariae]